MRRMAVGLVLVAGAMTEVGCGVLGPSCLDRQERGFIAPVPGEVAAGGTAVHVIAYDPRGSQNDVEVSWQGQGTAAGPRLRLHATRVECEAGPETGAPPASACAVLASAGTLPDGNVATRLIVTNGRGNPDVLGTPPRFKVWVIGDPTLAATYTLTQSWFYGPDC